MALQWKTIPLQCSAGLAPTKRKKRLVSTQERSLAGMFGYEKSRHGYGDTHVGIVCVDAFCRPEIRARRSAPDAGEGKLLVKGKVADSCLLRKTTGRLSVS